MRSGSSKILKRGEKLNVAAATTEEEGSRQWAAMFTDLTAAASTLLFQ